MLKTDHPNYDIRMEILTRLSAGLNRGTPVNLLMRDLGIRLQKELMHHVAAINAEHGLHLMQRNAGKVIGRVIEVPYAQQSQLEKLGEAYLALVYPDDEGEADASGVPEKEDSPESKAQTHCPHCRKRL